MRSVIAVAALAVLAGGLAACDGASTQSRVPVTTQPADQGNASTVAPASNEPPTAPGAGPSPADLPTRDDATVDARDYQQRNNFYFQSPTGNILCGFVEEGTLGVGCQLADTHVIPPELPTCDNSPARKVAAHIYGGTAEFLCTNQGFFVGEPVDGTNKGGGKTLNYGDTIIVRGAACTSTQQGVRCDADGHGFFISADRQYLF
ncbi:DUF6636 domain-containing protein [Nocardia sp. NPDC060249]|uniref:DUF6636 domain-containing protein n=1 Tax=Nocardia sp. NPDC060249 TaxID=3347082 RepID=UPI00365FE121